MTARKQFDRAHYQELLKQEGKRDALISISEWGIGTVIGGLLAWGAIQGIERWLEHSSPIESEVVIEIPIEDARPQWIALPPAVETIEL